MTEASLLRRRNAAKLNGLLTKSARESRQRAACPEFGSAAQRSDARGKQCCQRLAPAPHPRHRSAPAAGCRDRARRSAAPSRDHGTTSSDRLAASQAMWPGKAWTSSTSCVSPLAAAVPHTPLPTGCGCTPPCPGTARAPVSLVADHADRSPPSSGRADTATAAPRRSPCWRPRPARPRSARRAPPAGRGRARPCDAGGHTSNSYISPPRHPPAPRLDRRCGPSSRRPASPWPRATAWSSPAAPRASRASASSSASRPRASARFCSCVR